MSIGIKLQNRTRKLLLLVGLMAGILTSSALVNYALAQSDGQVEANSDEHVVSIYDRGEERVFVTKARTIRQALKAAKIDVDESVDVVEPGLDSEMVAQKYNVNIFRARPVTVVDGDVRLKVTTAQQTPELIAKVANVTLYEEDKVNISSGDSILVDGADLVMNINRATELKLKLYGKTSTVRTHVKTVGELLKEKNITMEKNDTLSVKESTPITANMTVEVWRNGKQTVTVKESIDFPVEKIQDADRDPSYQLVKEVGQKGSKNVTYEIVMKNGKEVSRKKIASVTTKQPKKQVEVVGAKFKYTGGPLNEAQIQALGMCESGMTATRNSGNGFYGAFQFMPSTWQSVAPAPYSSGMPHEAPLAAQKQAVQNLLSRSSIFSQFPGCAKQMRSNGII